MKVKLICAVFSLFLLVLPCFSEAGDVQKNDPTMNSEMTQNIPDMDLLKDAENIEAKKPFLNHSIELSLMYHYFDYKEDVPGPGKSTETGWLPGIYAGWKYDKKNAVYSKVFFEFSYEDTEYDGTDQSGIIPIKYSHNNPQFLFRGEWDIGYNFAVTKNISLKPYVGYGFRRWSRGDSEWRTVYYESIPLDMGTPKEIYYWHYLPVGVAAEFTVGDKLVIQPNAGLRIMFYGEMKAYLSELNRGYNDPKFELGNKIGWYAEIPVTYKFSQTWAIVMKPWYEYSEIGKSDTERLTYNGTTYGYSYEPSSRTHQYGVNVGIVASF